MRKLMLSMLLVASLGAAGAAFADAESQAGSAWRSDATPGPIPGTPEYYGNSGWPPLQQQPYVYDNRVYDNRIYGDRYDPYVYRRGEQPAYPYVRPRRGDRDGDGVPNRLDRHPDDPYRY